MCRVQSSCLSMADGPLALGRVVSEAGVWLCSASLLPTGDGSLLVESFLSATVENKQDPLKGSVLMSWMPTDGLLRRDQI